MADNIRGVVAFILVLGGLVLIHEFGHFIVAKIFRIRVVTFSVGFGTRLFGWRKGDTDYRLSLLPLGGYVKLAGETTDEELTGEPWEFMSHPRWQQLCVMFAGPMMNLLAALAIPAAVAMIHYDVPAYVTKPAAIGAVDPGSAGEKAGLKAGDVVIDVDGYSNPTWGDFSGRIALNSGQPMKLTVNRDGQIQHLDFTPTITEDNNTAIGTTKGLQPVLGPKAQLYVDRVNSGEPADQAGLKPDDQILAFNGIALEQDYAGGQALIDRIQHSDGKPVTLTVKRDGQTISIQAVPRLNGDVYQLGFYSGTRDGETVVTRLSMPAAVKYAYHQNLEIIRLTEAAIAQVFRRERPASQVVGGPIAIFTYTRDAARQGLAAVLWLTELLSLNLAIINLFPIPILDGGRIFMIALDSVLGVIGLQLSKVAKERMMQVGFFVIVALMAVVMINDIRQHVIPAKATTHQTQAPAANK